MPPLLLMVTASSLFFTKNGSAASPLRTGPRFRQTLQGAVNVVRPQSEFREITERLAEIHEIAVLLDRRIDPNRVIDVQLSQLTLIQGLQSLAAQGEAEAAVIGGTVMFGPPAALDRMRTDIAIQVDRLKDLEGEAERQRTFDLLQRRSFRWNDVETPSQLLRKIADEFSLAVENVEMIPHDLWAHGVISDVNAVEALVIVAGQFDLTFKWSDDLSSIRLEPSPPRLVIDRQYDASSEQIETLMRAAADFPHVQLKPRDGGIRVVGTLGEQERIARLLQGDDAQNDPPMPESAPLRRRTFTITTQPVPVIAVLRHLETQDVIVEYNAQELEAAGIDLLQKVTLSLNEASADEFFHALCDPVNLAFEIEGKTVRLSPHP